MTDNESIIYVLGDLQIDYHIDECLFENGIQNKKGIPFVSGTGFNAAKAFHKMGLPTTILGYIGNDSSGLAIKKRIYELGISSILHLNPDKKTAIFHMIFSKNYKNGIRLYIDEINNSNNISLNQIKSLLNETKSRRGIDYIYLTTQFLLRNSLKNSKDIVDLIASFGLLIIVDVVPHSIYRTITYSDFTYVFGNNIHILNGELYTISNISNLKCNNIKPSDKDLHKIIKLMKCDILVLSYGRENNTSHMAIKSGSGTLNILNYIKDTGFINLSAKERIGFGDYVFSKFMFNIINQVDFNNKTNLIDR